MNSRSCRWLVWALLITAPGARAQRSAWVFARAGASLRPRHPSPPATIHRFSRNVSAPQERRDTKPQVTSVLICAPLSVKGGYYPLRGFCYR
jgi:hypothetical protein